MIAALLSTIAGAATFSASVALHSKIVETPSAPHAFRLALDAAGVVAVGNALALLTGHAEDAEHVAGAAVFAGLAVATWFAVAGPRNG